MKFCCKIQEKIHPLQDISIKTYLKFFNPSLLKISLLPQIIWVPDHGGSVPSPGPTPVPVVLDGAGWQQVVAVLHHGSPLSRLPFVRNLQRNNSKLLREKNGRLRANDPLLF